MSPTNTQQNEKAKNNVISILPLIGTGIRQKKKLPNEKQIENMERRILKSEINYLVYSLIVAEYLKMPEVDQTTEFKHLIEDLEKLTMVKSTPKRELAIKDLINSAKTNLQDADTNADGKVDQYDFIHEFIKDDNTLFLRR